MVKNVVLFSVNNDKNLTLIDLYDLDDVMVNNKEYIEDALTIDNRPVNGPGLYRCEAYFDRYGDIQFMETKQIVNFRQEIMDYPLVNSN